MEVGLSLGSNLGNRLANLRKAVDLIARLPGIRVAALAPLYETDPVDARPAYAHLRYLNTVVILEIQARSDLHALSKRLHAIEDELGRERSDDRNAPRTLDIDILYAGSVERLDGILDLPHPRWAQRRFVVQPLADVRPHLRLPGETRSVAAILADLPSAGINRVDTPDWPLALDRPESGPVASAFASRHHSAQTRPLTG